MVNQKSQTRKVDAFEILLARLDWPLRPVRLMVARRLADLMTDDHDNNKRKRFLKWIAERKTETEVVNGLVVLGLSKDKPIIEMSELMREIKCPSILADNYIEAIYGTRPQVVSWGDATSGSAMAGFQKSGQFTDGIDFLAAPIFRSIFNGLEKEYGFSFMEQWEWEWHCLSNQEKRNSPYLRYFSDDTLGQIIRGDFEPREGEVFKSAFIRTLHLAIIEWGMPISFAVDIANISAPANLDLARIEPSTNPLVRPSYYSDDSIDEVMSSKSIHKMFITHSAVDDGEIMVAANGHICKSKKRWVEVEYLSGFAKDTSSISSEKYMQILRSHKHNIHALHLPSTINIQNVKEENKDENINPIFLRLFPEDFGWPRSHINMISRGLFAPHPKLFGGEIKWYINEDSIVYTVNGKAVGRWIYWYNPWSSSHSFESTGTIGTALIMQKDALGNLERATDCKIKASVHITKHFRHDEYKEWQSETTTSYVQ